jgi:uncharacterized protein YndB with AHSA1/START domain
MSRVEPESRLVTAWEAQWGRLMTWRLDDVELGPRAVNCLQAEALAPEHAIRHRSHGTWRLS